VGEEREEHAKEERVVRKLKMEEDRRDGGDSKRREVWRIAMRMTSKSKVAELRVCKKYFGVREGREVIRALLNTSGWVLERMPNGNVKRGMIKLFLGEKDILYTYNNGNINAGRNIGVGWPAMVAEIRDRLARMRGTEFNCCLILLKIRGRAPAAQGRRTDAEERGKNHGSGVRRDKEPHSEPEPWYRNGAEGDRDRKWRRL
jgi:hypothetical protein